MKLIKQVTINFAWWHDDHGLEEMDNDHAEALEESVMKRIISMMKEGYTSGELNDNISMHDTDPEDGIGYSGWWSLSWKTL